MLPRGSARAAGNPEAASEDGSLTFEEELKRIESEIRKLKIQFDLYFTGANPKPPTDQRDALDKLIKKHQNSSKTVADRFLYNAIVNKFNAYSELWTKTLRIKEEGARVHPLALRAAQQAATSETGGSNGSAASSRAEKRRGRPSDGDGVWRIPARRSDDSVLKELYASFIAAKEQSGDGRKPTFDVFAREVQRHAAALRQKVDCDSIDFKIYCRDNKVSLKAKPSK